ncbi:MAG: hypothetical protein U1D30_26555 [Planctomycetota bacterium]
MSRKESDEKERSVGLRHAVADPLRIVLRRHWRAGVFVLAITVLIAILRREIIDAPPYYDFGFSVWLEARYLANSGLDYWGLRYDEQFLLAKEGGTRAYMTSVLPTVIAIFLRVFPTTRGALIAYHGFTFFCAGIVAYSIHAILRRRLGHIRAFLLVVVMMTTPVLCTQIDMMGMEIPLAAMTSLAALALDRGAYGWSVVAAFGAFLMKASGLIVSVALSVVLFALLFFGFLGAKLDRDEFRRLGKGWLWSVAVLGLEYFLIQWGGAFHGQIMGGAPLTMTLIWCPDLVAVALFAVAIGGLQTYRWLRRTYRTSWSVRQWGGMIHQGIAENRTIPFACLVILGIVAAVYRGPFLVRYLAFVVPMLYLALALPIFAWGKRWRGGLAFLVVVLVVNLVNWNGQWYPDISEGFVRFWGIPGPALARSGSFFERSHEYLPDYRGTLEVVEYLDKNGKGQTVVAGLPFTFFLEFPEFGYVAERMGVYSINAIKGIDPKAKDASDLIREKPSRVLFVRVPNYFTISTPRFDIPPPTKGDTLLFTDGDRYPLLIYRKEWGTTKEELEAKDRWYAEHSWRAEPFAARLFSEMRHGDLSVPIRTLKNELANHLPPGRKIQLECMLAYVLLHQGDAKGAETLFRSNGITDEEEGDPSDLMPLSPVPQFQLELTDALANPNDTWSAFMVCLKHCRLPEAAWVARKKLLRRFPPPVSSPARPSDAPGKS